MHKQGGKIVLWGIIIGMLAYTAIRTIHFLQLTLPADQQYVAYIGLIAFDVGVLAWFYYAISAAEGATQRAIAYGMIFVCATGVCTTTVMDMTLGASRNGLYAVPPQWFTVGLWAVILVIITNFIAGICVHLNDPEQKKRMEIQHVQDEIHALTLKKIREQKNTIAPKIANAIAADWANQTIMEMTNHLGVQSAQQMPQLPAGQIVDSTSTQQTQSPTQQPAQQKGLLGRLGDAITGKQEPLPTFTAPSTLDYTPPGGDWNNVWKQPATPTPVPQLPDSQEYLDLLDKAVKYGQITPEKAQPLRDAITGQFRVVQPDKQISPLATPASLSQNGHVTPEQSKE